jgi:hypothetical protein
MFLHFVSSAAHWTNDSIAAALGSLAADGWNCASPWDCRAGGAPRERRDFPAEYSKSLLALGRSNAQAVSRAWVTLPVRETLTAS